jgi:hypothetical protein
MPSQHRSWLQRLFCCTNEAAVNVAIHPVPHTTGPVVGPAPALSAPPQPRRRRRATPPPPS